MRKSLFSLSAVMLSIAMLSGCVSQGGTKPDSNTAADTTTTEPAAPAKTFQEGTVAEFDKTGAKLSKTAIAYLAEISVTIHQANSVEITGYCDRKDNILGAQDLALARAGAVRAELIRLGVPATKMRVKYITAEAKHSASITLK